MCNKDKDTEILEISTLISTLFIIKGKPKIWSDHSVNRNSVR